MLVISDAMDCTACDLGSACMIIRTEEEEEEEAFYMLQPAAQ